MKLSSVLVVINIQLRRKVFLNHCRNIQQEPLLNHWKGVEIQLKTTYLFEWGKRSHV